MFQAGDPVQIQFKLGNSAVALRGKLAQAVRSLIEVHLTDEPVHDGSLKPGSGVVVVISSSTGIYTSEATVQRYYPPTGQLVVTVNGCFRHQQRRQHERYRCEMQVHLRAAGETDWIAGICRDISAGGARIYVPQELVLKSTSLEVVFISPSNQQAVRAMAEVARTSKLLDDVGWELGVRFTEMNRMEKIHFARLLQHWASVGEREPIQP